MVATAPRDSNLSRFRRLLCLCTAAVLLVACDVSGVRGDRMTVQTGQHPYAFQEDDLHINYLLYLPDSYGRNPWKRWPLLIFLHGSGETGLTMEHLSRVAANGPPRELAGPVPLPDLADNFIVLSPQSPDNQYWETQFAVLDALLAEIESTYAIDPPRVYLTGLSLGGFGTWQYAERHPDHFAALVPVAAGYDHVFETRYVGAGYYEGKIRFPAIPDSLCSLKHIPVWVFHGARDETIPHNETANVVVDAFRACGGNVSYTLYPDAGHDSWTETYANPELYRWLLAQRKD